MSEVKPQIVSQEMILDILKKIEKSDDVIKIVKFSTGPSSERGENWSSLLIRLKDNFFSCF